MKHKINEFSPKVKVGTDITVSDGVNVDCYYVTEVIDPKTIKAKPYNICADKEKAHGMGHQEWKYFKTVKEEAEYLGEDYNGYEPDEQTWCIKYHDIKVKTKTGYHSLVDAACKWCGYIAFGVLSYGYCWEF